MYRQFNIHEKDTQYQKMLWRSTAENGIKTLIKTITCRTTSTPYLSIRYLYYRLAEEDRESFSIASKVVT